jgi:hypothetical protein
MKRSDAFVSQYLQSSDVKERPVLKLTDTTGDSLRDEEITFSAN